MVLDRRGIYQRCGQVDDLDGAGTQGGEELGEDTHLATLGRPAEGT